MVVSRNEEFMYRTVQDLHEKARGEHEIIVLLDEKDQPVPDYPEVRVIKKVGPPGLRTAINQAVEAARGKYVMKTDGHCMYDEGFDVKLAANMEDNWVVIPRRYSLIPETWEINPARPIIDYEYLVFPFVEELHSVRTGGKWYQRAIDRKELILDEEMAFQGSCWFTTKEHFQGIGAFDVNTATGDQFVLESEELANKTWLSGGKCMVNKATWYAHLHKGSRGRGYLLNTKHMKRQRAFHIDYWFNNKWPQAIRSIEWLIERFWPIPGWPEDWRDPKWQENYVKNNPFAQYYHGGPWV